MHGATRWCRINQSSIEKDRRNTWSFIQILIFVSVHSKTNRDGFFVMVSLSCHLFIGEGSMHDFGVSLAQGFFAALFESVRIVCLASVSLLVGVFFGGDSVHKLGITLSWSFVSGDSVH